MSDDKKKDEIKRLQKEIEKLKGYIERLGGCKVCHGLANAHGYGCHGCGK